ncbi:fibronectin type III domain-containing protein [Adhaeribacter aquaticus]|uniref:fibronectin type III domain-containing protein n=1 Tax=Adhaeribacter aquaticus TaxID=299567 RepID=UPI00040B646B|nr:T9SS type A sorting domain-containing protein [Adhaeribacter aquaticus]
MRHLYQLPFSFTRNRQFFFLLWALFIISSSTKAQTPFPLATGIYTENFDRIGSWGANFTGTGGVTRFSVATPETTGGLPNQNTVFSSGSGVQRGPNNASIVIYASGTTTLNAAAFDLNLDFTNTTAGTLSFDWFSLNTGSGFRQARFSVRTNSGTNSAFEELPGTAVILTNNRPSSGTITVNLPSSFSGKPNARIRFYIETIIGTANNGLSGARPRIAIDNIRATATYVGTNPNTITTGEPNQNTFTVTPTAPSATFTVPYTSTGGFTGNWRVQLSNNEGVFSTDETFNIIGTGNGTSPITAQIPAGTPCGTNYRVRVINTNPLRFGNSNATPLTVNSTPAANTVVLDNTDVQSVTPSGTGSGVRAIASSPSTFAWFYRTGTSGTFMPIPNATSSTYTINGADFPGAGIYQIVSRATAINACGNVTGESAPVTVNVQSLSVSPAAIAFTETRVGLTSSVQTFTITGTGVSENITVTPPANFQIRLSGTTDFQSTPLTVTPTSGNVNQMVDVRFAPTAAQAYSGNISVVSSLNTANVAVTGTGQDVGVNTTALSFGPTPIRTASPSQNFTVTGVGLTSNVTVTAPTGYQIRLAGSTGEFTTSPLTLTPSGGNVNATIEVRLAPTVVQAYVGNITVSSSTSTVNVAVSGSGISTPVLSTRPVTAITASSASTGGDISSNNGSSVTARGVVWGTAPNPSIESNSSTTDGSGVGGYTSTLTNLQQHTTYYVRAYATNAAGTAYGNEVPFTTQPAAPTQQVSNITFPEESIGANSLTLTWMKGNGTGTVVVINRVNSFSIPVDGQPVTNVNSAYTAAGEQVVYLGNNTQTSATITNLQPSTQYFFRVYEINNSGEFIRYNTSGGSVSASTIAPLPVEMVFFKGKLMNFSVLLEWRTASEKNSSHYNIMRSLDGNHFTKIGRVKSAGNSSVMQHYSFQDANAGGAEVIYYALEQVDLDGTSTRSRVVSVKAGNALLSKVRIAPNPVADRLTILPGGMPVQQCIILDAAGKTVLVTVVGQQDNEPFVLDISRLATGVYVLQLTNLDGGNEQIRFVKTTP